MRSYRSVDNRITPWHSIKMNKTTTSIVLYLLSLILIIFAIIYFTLPANQLPAFMPGYSADLTKKHVTHGIGALVLALVVLAVAWFRGGKKSAKTSDLSDK